MIECLPLPQDGGQIQKVPKNDVITTLRYNGRHAGPILKRPVAQLRRSLLCVRNSAHAPFFLLPAVVVLDLWDILLVSYFRFVHVRVNIAIIVAFVSYRGSFFANIATTQKEEEKAQKEDEEEEEETKEEEEETEEKTEEKAKEKAEEGDGEIEAPN